MKQNRWQNPSNSGEIQLLQCSGYLQVRQPISKTNFAKSRIYNDEPLALFFLPRCFLFFHGKLEWAERRTEGATKKREQQGILLPCFHEKLQILQELVNFFSAPNLAPPPCGSHRLCHHNKWPMATLFLGSMWSKRIKFKGVILSLN